MSRATGRFVVGYSGDPAIQSTPVRWKLRRDERAQIQSLGLPTGFQNGFPTAVSANGRRVVGSCNLTRDGEFIFDTFVWDEGRGITLLQARLLALGQTNFSGWTQSSATGISDDGRTLCGYGTNPQGIERAWVAVLPTNHHSEDRDEKRDADSDDD